MKEMKGFHVHGKRLTMFSAACSSNFSNPGEKANNLTHIFFSYRYLAILATHCSIRNIHLFVLGIRGIDTLGHEATDYKIYVTTIQMMRIKIHDSSNNELSLSDQIPDEKEFYPWISCISKV